MRIGPSLVLILAACETRGAAPLASQFVVDIWNTRTGLPEETVYSVTQSADGYLWLANANGLVRYDGTSFQVFQPRQDLGGGVKQEMARMGPGPDNSVWIYSTPYGLVRFQKGVFERAPEYPKPCTVMQILEDGTGTLIVCQEKILRIAGETVEDLTKALGPAAKKIKAAARDEEGHLWIGWNEGGLTRLGLDGQPEIAYGPQDGMPPGAVNQVLAAGANRIWAGTEHGLALAGKGLVTVYTTRDGLPSDNVRRLIEGRDKSLWVGTTRGVALVRDGHFEVVSRLPPGWVESMFEDREDNVWIAFSDMNLYRLRKPKFLFWGVNEGLPTDRPRAVVKSGDTFVTAQQFGLWKFTEGSSKAIAVKAPPMRFLETDDAGGIWAISAAKAYQIDRAAEQVREVPLPEGSAELISLGSGLAGRMWILTRSELLLAGNGRVKRASFSNFPALVGRSDVRQSRDGRLWLSVNKSGLYELRDGKAVPISLGADPELQRIYTFYIDSSNDFWFGFDGGGLARWRNGKLARYGHQIGRPLNFVYHFGEDTEGHFWLGLRAGLARVSKAELNAFLDGSRAAEPSANYYDIDDGLPSSNFGGANRTVASMTPQSVLWFPSLLGIVRIEARNIPINRAIPPVHLEEVSADGRTLPLGTALTIPAGTDILRFSFSVPTLVAQSRVQISYQLSPWDETWQTTASRSVSYSRVPPGTYTFSVKASNNDGVWNEQGATIGVVVAPRFFQTWWFRLSGALLIALGIGAVYRWRTGRLRREKERLEERVELRTAELSEAVLSAESATRAKTDFLATMSHEIRTPMHGVLGTLELLSETGLNEEQGDYLDTARDSSNSLLALLNNILDLSKMEAGRMDLRISPFSLRQIALEVTRLLQAQANVHAVALLLSYAPDLPEYFDGDEVRVRQIVFNLAGNAVKFTTEGHVTIEIGGQREPAGRWRLRIAVRDSGIGIPPDRIPSLFQNFVQVNSAANRRVGGSGLGLAICQRLAATMDGSITVESQLGRGSTFTFLVELPEAAGMPAENPIAERTAGRLFDADVLLAEDNRVNQMLAINMLTHLGCRVTVAQNGREAVDLARQRFFPVILMDLQMPEIDGLEASRLIRAAVGDEPKIIALTANALPGDRELCLQAGMNDYLAKPFQRSDLVRVLARYLPIAPPAEAGITTIQ